MLIPIRTSRDLKRRPRVTGTLIILTMLVHLLALVLEARGIVSRDAIIRAGSLSAADFRPWTLLSYQFLHDPSSIWHLAFNMLFLWVFGSAVEDRLGHVGFACFHLLGGVAAGLAHMAWSPAPVIGASGAVAATTGAFAAFAPRARVQVLVLFFLIMMISVPAVWFVAFYVAIDFLRSVGDLLGGGSRVAYVAHLAGYAFGFGVAVTLLATGRVPRDDFDIWFLFRQARRRAEFRRATRGTPAGPWDAPTADTDRRLRQTSRRGTTAAASTDPVVPPELAARRRTIEEMVATHRLEEAAAAYARLQAEHPGIVLTPDAQVDVANQLHAEGRAADAAEAYRRLLHRAPAHPRSAEIRLLLAALTLRTLRRPAEARTLLEGVRRDRLDPDHRTLLESLEAEARAAAAGGA